MAEFSAIILAAGNSNRLGFGKGLVDVGGVPWITWQAQALAKCGFRQVIVVVGPSHGRQYCEALVKTCKTSFVVAHNREEGADYFSSLKAGISAAVGMNSRLSGVLVQPLDIPTPSRLVVKQLVGEMAGNPAVLSCQPQFEQRVGHPVLLRADLARKILAGDGGDAGPSRLDIQLRNLSGSERCLVPVQDGNVLVNLNTSAEWREFLCSNYPELIRALRPSELPVCWHAADLNLGPKWWPKKDLIAPGIHC